MIVTRSFLHAEEVVGSSPASLTIKTLGPGFFRFESLPLACPVANVSRALTSGHQFELQLLALKRTYSADREEESSEAGTRIYENTKGYCSLVTRLDKLALYGYKSAYSCRFLRKINLLTDIFPSMLRS